MELKMLLLFKNAICPSCNGHHDLYAEERRFSIVLPAHDFVCPVTGQRTVFHPDVFAHRVNRFPDEAIALLDHVEEPTRGNLYKARGGWRLAGRSSKR